LRKNTKKYYVIILCGLLIALQAVLKKIIAIDLGFLVINFDFVAIALGGAILGPVWNGLVCAVTDIVGFILFPGRDPFFPGFTLSAFLKGLTYGFFLYCPLPFLNGVKSAGANVAAKPDKSHDGQPDGSRAAGYAGRLSESLPDPKDSGTRRAPGPLSDTKLMLIRTALGAFCVTILIEATLNSLWVSILYNKAYLFYFGTRLIKSIAMLPVHVAVFGAIWRPLGKYIESAVTPVLSKRS
jgi:ECF transporter S component (folate family)